LHCEAGGFHIDPWRPVERALVTHGHADHARPGSRRYLTAAPGAGVVRERVGRDAAVEGIPYGERRAVGGVTVSFHPAGHLLGSAQIRVERGGEVWVVTGDYKTAPDRSCEPFEPLRCHTLVTESTFGLPVYRWPAPEDVFAEINAWWQANREAGRTSVLFAYALGKAQRALCGIDPSIGLVGVHGAVDALLPHYRSAGRPIPETARAGRETRDALRGGGLVVAPPSARNTPWIRRFAPYSLASASGWMRIRGTRRRKALDRGFVLSDHADWDGIAATVEASGAERVGATHGYTGPLVRWLREAKGLEAFELATRYAGENAGDTGRGAEQEEANSRGA